jgi:O-antigen/teichoic acid export membrane protein
LTELHQLISSPINFIIFTFIITVGSWQQIDNALFIAKKSAHWIFFESIVFSSFKISLIYPLIFLGGFGIFLSNFLGLAFASLISFIVLFTRFKVRLTGGVNTSILKEIGKYSLGSYSVGLIGLLPGQLLPAMVAQTINPESAAHFFLALMMVNLISVVPLASSQVLFAAGSADPRLLKSLVLRSVKVQVALISVALIAIWLFSGWIFSFFGKEYAEQTVSVLKILSLAVVPIVISAPLSIRLRVRKQLHRLAFIQIIGTTSILTASYFGGNHGLLMMSWGYVFGQTISCIALLIDWKLIHLFRNRDQ